MWNGSERKGNGRDGGWDVMIKGECPSMEQSEREDEWKEGRGRKMDEWQRMGMEKSEEEGDGMGDG